MSSTDLRTLTCVFLHVPDPHEYYRIVILTQNNEDTALSQLIKKYRWQLYDTYL